VPSSRVGHRRTISLCIRGSGAVSCLPAATDSLDAVEEELPEGADGAKGAERSDPPSVGPGGIPPLPAELSEKAQELRALIDAGAASPEELRELAARLKAQRSYEEAVWAREVRPALMKAKKKKPSLLDLRRDGVEGDSSSIVLGVTLLIAVLLLLLIATQTSFLILLVGAAGVLVYAWVHGAQPADQSAPEPPPGDPTD
jgi:hypothetical protein